MGVYASMLEFESPQRLAAHDLNTIILSRLLLALFDLSRPELCADRKAGSISLTPFKHQLLFISSHLRPAQAFGSIETQQRYPELAISRSPESVMSRLTDVRGAHAYTAESKKGTKSGVVRIFVAVQNLHHLGLHVWHIPKHEQVAELRTILQANPQFLCLISGVVSSPTDVLTNFYTNLSEMNIDDDIESELEHIAAEDRTSNMQKAASDKVMELHNEEWQRLQLLFAINAADLKLLAHHQPFVSATSNNNLAQLTLQSPRVNKSATVFSNSAASTVMISAGRRSSVSGASVEMPSSARTVRRSSIVAPPPPRPATATLSAVLQVVADRSHPVTARVGSLIGEVPTPTPPTLPSPATSGIATESNRFARRASIVGMLKK